MINRGGTMKLQSGEDRAMQIYAQTARDAAFRGKGGLSRLQSICETAPECLTVGDRERGAIAMHKAAESNCPDVVRFIHQVAPHSLNHQDKFGWTPMYIAADKGSVAVLKTMLELGGDASSTNYRGDTPLAIALRQCRHEACECLQGWLQMSSEHRAAVTTYGWPYFEMPTWRPRDHHIYPSHLRSQTLAIALSVPQIFGDTNMLMLFTSALDARKRHHDFDPMDDEGLFQLTTAEQQDLDESQVKRAVIGHSVEALGMHWDARIVRVAQACH